MISCAPDHLIFRRSHADETLICAFNFGPTLLTVPAKGETLAGQAPSGQLPPNGYVIQRGAG